MSALSIRLLVKTRQQLDRMTHLPRQRCVSLLRVVPRPLCETFNCCCHAQSPLGVGADTRPVASSYRGGSCTR